MDSDYAILTEQELADRLKVTTSTIRRWVRRRLIQSIDVGRGKLMYDYVEVLHALLARPDAMRIADAVRPEQKRTA